ncbi:MAG: hypothetical protein Kow0081_2450 [Candidatus Dojkabacteria bacterium]
MDAKVLIEEGHEDLVLIKPTDTFNYLSGYFSINQVIKRGKGMNISNYLRNKYLGFLKIKCSM